MPNKGHGIPSNIKWNYFSLLVSDYMPWLRSWTNGHPPAELGLVVLIGPPTVDVVVKPPKPPSQTTKTWSETCAFDLHHSAT